MPLDGDRGITHKHEKQTKIIKHNIYITLTEYKKIISMKQVIVMFCYRIILVLT